MTTRHIVTGKQLEMLLCGCPCDALPEGVFDDEDTNEVYVSGQPLNKQARYRVWNTANERRPLGDSIDADWSVELAN